MVVFLEEEQGQFKAISRQLELSLHGQVMQQLREAIENNVWLPGQQIPTEKELQELLGVSRSTIREAMTELVKQGYIVRQAGKGTYIAPAKIEDQSQRTSGYVQQRYGSNATSEMLWIKWITCDEYDSKLNLDVPPGAEVLQFQRLLMNKDIPFGLTTVSVVVKNREKLDKRKLDMYSVVHIVQAFGGFKVVRTERTLEAVVATEMERKILKMVSDTPLLLAKSVHYAENGAKVGMTKALYRGDIYKYKISIGV